jgi:hypothetical protein
MAPTFFIFFLAFLEVGVVQSFDFNADKSLLFVNEVSWWWGN